MKDIGSLLKLPETTKGSEKGEIIKELYVLYTSENARKHRKNDNWTGYRMWLMDNYKAVTKFLVYNSKNIDTFKKSKQFIKERDIKSFSIGLSKHRKEVLYEILSIAKDREHRKENVGGYIGSNFWKYGSTQDV